MINDYYVKKNHQNTTYKIYKKQIKAHIFDFDRAWTRNLPWVRDRANQLLRHEVKWRSDAKNLGPQKCEERITITKKTTILWLKYRKKNPQIYMSSRY